MAKIFDARDPGFRIMTATGFAVLCMALAMVGARFVAAAEVADVEVNLDVLKTLPAGKSGDASKAIELTPPTAKKRNAGRREEALRRARKKRLIEQAKRKAAARGKAEAARKAAARKKAEAARKAGGSKPAEEARQSEEIERKAKAEREAAAARKAKAAAAKKAAKARSAKPAVVPQKAPVTEAAKETKKPATDVATKSAEKSATSASPKPKAGADVKKQIATRTARLPIGRARLLFGKESTALGNAEKEKLETIATRMISEEKALLVIYAYAAGDGSSSSEARRLSLSRALAVRRAITGRGIPAIRTEIRALGARAGTGPSDRVDLVLVQR